MLRLLSWQFAQSSQLAANSAALGRLLPVCPTIRVGYPANDSMSAPPP